MGYPWNKPWDPKGHPGTPVFGAEREGDSSAGAEGCFVGVAGCGIGGLGSWSGAVGWVEGVESGLGGAAYGCSWLAGWLRDGCGCWGWVCLVGAVAGLGCWCRGVWLVGLVLGWIRLGGLLGA